MKRTLSKALLCALLTANALTAKNALTTQSAEDVELRRIYTRLASPVAREKMRNDAVLLDFLRSSSHLIAKTILAKLFGQPMQQQVVSTSTCFSGKCRLR